MAKARTPNHPTCWRIIAGPESLTAYTQDRRPAIAMWTADRAGNMRRGDVALMYATRRFSSYIAVARVCCEPVLNDRAVRLRRSNRRPWVYLQIQPLSEPIHGSSVAGLAWAKVRGSGLNMPRGGRANAVDDGALADFQGLLRNRDPASAARLARWLRGCGEYPRDLDLNELRRADWERPVRATAQELELSRRIAKNLVATRRYRYLTEADDRVAASSRGNLSLEYPIRDLAGVGRVDILLADRQANARTLLAIEVKIEASLSPGRNPLTQITRYRAALRDAFPEATIAVMVIAVQFHPAVTEEADAHDIPWQLVTPTGRLKARR